VGTETASFAFLAIELDGSVLAKRSASTLLALYNKRFEDLILSYIIQLTQKSQDLSFSLVVGTDRFSMADLFFAFAFFGTVGAKLGSSTSFFAARLICNMINIIRSIMRKFC